MKKTYVAAIATGAALLIVLAAAVALVQYQPSQSPSGKLAVMGTDPPVTSSGVSDATASYSSVYAHQSGSDMASGWTQVSGSGTLDLMAQGTAQTMAASQVSAASYDAFRFNIDSVKVVYQGQTYAATVASSTVTATSNSQVQVTSGSSAAAVVDLRTIIVNTASSSSPQFVFTASAAATSVPPQSASTISLSLGSTHGLSGQAWWSAFVAQTSTNLNVDATLTASSLAVQMQKAGSADAQVQEIIVTPVSATAYASSSLPSSLNGSAVFAVTGSGSVAQSSAIQASSMLNGGATVASGSATNLAFDGSIATSASAQASGIVSGQEYIVTVIGANTYASTTVVAS